MIRRVRRHLPAWLSALAVSAMLVMATSSAHAQSFALKSGQVAVLGMAAGDAWIMFARLSDNACTWRKLGTGGLTGNVVLNGTEGAEAVSLQTSPVPRCDGPGSLAPLVFNGYSVTVDLKGGNDSTHMTPNGQHVVVKGGSGNDVLRNVGGFQTYGGSGDDNLSGGNGDFMFGDGGNDYVKVEPGAWATGALGGPGGDILCGQAVVQGEFEYYGCLN
jgi:Ca2+-binding RTX toxin-like protein